MGNFPDFKKVIDLPKHDTESPRRSCTRGCLYDTIPLLSILGSGAYLYYLLRNSGEFGDFLIPAVIIGISLYAISKNIDGYGPK